MPLITKERSKRMKKIKDARPQKYAPSRRTKGRLDKLRSDLVPESYQPKIICVMAVYKRPAITIKTIDLMKRQKYPLEKIIIVGSDRIDYEVAERTGVEYLQHENMPLSNKWQYGINYARQFEPDAILINGSDSWLTTNWCAETKDLLHQGYDLIGKTQFYSCKVNPNEKIQVVHRTYKSRQDPVGAGRLISKDILDRLDWKWFPAGRRTGLDGTSFKNMKRRCPDAEVKYINDMQDVLVMGVKSTTWDTINPFRFVMSDPQFTKAGEVEDPKLWLENVFPGSLSIFKELVPGVIIE